MAFYTPDGIRHENKEEALIHTQDFLLTELPPTEDNEKHLTSFSLYPSDLSTQELITKAVSNK